MSFIILFFRKSLRNLTLLTKAQARNMEQRYEDIFKINIESKFSKFTYRYYFSLIELSPFLYIFLRKILK